MLELRKRSIGVTMWGAIFIMIGLGLLSYFSHHPFKGRSLVNKFISSENEMIENLDNKLKSKELTIMEQNRYIALENAIEYAKKNIHTYFQRYLHYYRMIESFPFIILFFIALGFISAGFGCFRLYSWTRIVIFLTSSCFTLVFGCLFILMFISTKLFTSALAEYGKVFKKGPPIIMLIPDAIKLIPLFLLIVCYIVVIYFFTRPSVKVQFENREEVV